MDWISGVRAHGTLLGMAARQRGSGCFLSIARALLASLRITAIFHDATSYYHYLAPPSHTTLSIFSGGL